MIIVDSNIWVAFFDTDDSTHKRATVIFEDLDNSNELAMTEYVFVEVCTILKNKKKFTIVKDFINFINEYNIEIMLLGGLLYRFTDTFTSSARNKLSFVDSSLLYLSQNHTVLTFDKALLAQIRKNK